MKQFKEIAYAANQIALDEAKQKASEKIRNWLASKSDSKYTKVYGHNAKRDRMSSSVVEGMNAADGTVYHGTGIRALTPGKMLEAIVFHSTKRADNRRKSARNASPTGATPGVVSLLKERKEGAEGKLKFRRVTFLGKTRDKAITNHGTPARGRSVSIGKKTKVSSAAFPHSRKLRAVACSSCARRPVLIPLFCSRPETPPSSERSSTRTYPK